MGLTYNDIRCLKSKASGQYGTRVGSAEQLCMRWLLALGCWAERSPCLPQPLNSEMLEPKGVNGKKVISSNGLCPELLSSWWVNEECQSAKERVLHIC